MSSVAEFVALSLISPAWRGDLGRELRAGCEPSTLLERLVQARGFARRTEGATSPRPRAHRRRGVADLRERAEAALALAQARGIAPLPWNDPDYPPALAAIADPPPVLWTKGPRAGLAAPAVAIVGSRAPSPYAVAVAERLAGDLAARGVLVVSGLARGVDSAAHRGALDASGTTLAVLGSGVDVIYPREHEGLARVICGRGLLVSELLPATAPRPCFFPWRNRIISGLSRAVVVVEAGEQSGSLITARCALDQGRDVLAVPGSVLTGRNRGGHALLRDGAKVVETADDIFEELGLDCGAPRPDRPGAAGRETNLSIDPLLGALADGEAADLDALADRTGLPASRLLPRLFDLEMAGFVGRLGGGRFVRVGRSC